MNDGRESIPGRILAIAILVAGAAVFVLLRVLAPEPEVAERVERLCVGHPLDPATEIGPLIHPRHFGKVTSYFDIARDEGVEIIDASVDAQKLLSAVVRTGERFGTEHLIAVVRGDETDGIRRFGHDQLPTYGVGADKTKP